MMMRRAFMFLAVAATTLMTWAQLGTADTQVQVVDSRVHSLKVAPLSNMYLPPVIMMNGDDRINVNFDLLD